MKTKCYFFFLSDVMCESEKIYFKKKKIITKLEYDVFYIKIMYSKQLAKYYQL